MAADGHYHAGFLQQRHELERSDGAALGVLPAQQRLHARHVAPGEVHDRLVAQRELVRVERALEVALELQPRERPGVHLGLEDLVVALAVVLGTVHGHVGVAQQLLGVAGRGDAAVAEGNAHAGGDRDVPVLTVAWTGERDRHAQRVHHALRDLDRMQLALGVVHEDRELVGAEARSGVHGPHAVIQTASDLLQHEVADSRPEAVVDVLEVVDVEDQYGDRQPVTALAGERVLDAIAKQRAVGQAGERVMEGLVL